MSFIFSKPQVFFCLLSGFLFLVSGCASPPSEAPVQAETLTLQPPALREASETPTSQALAYFSLGLTRELEQDYPGAIEAFLEAIKREPENDEFYMIAIRRLVQAERENDAFLLLEKLLAFQPGNVTARRWMAKLYLQNGEAGKALNELLQAVSSHPCSETVYLEAIQLALKAEDLDQVLSIARQARDHADSPKNSNEILIKLLINRQQQAPDAQTLVSLGEEISQTLEESIQTFPEEKRFLLIRADMKLQTGKWAAAFEDYQLLDQRFGSTEEIRTEILLHALKNSPGGRRGLRFVRQQLESLPDSALQSFLTGLIHEISEDLEAAVKAYETAFQLNPADVAALRRTAILNYQMGRTLRASTLIQEVLTLQPDDAGTLLLAGQLALGAENYPLARRYLERCLYRVRQGAALENQSTAHAQLAAVLFALEEEASLIMDHLVPAAADPGNLEWIWRFAQRKIYLLREQDLRKSEQMELGLIGIFEDLSDLDPENPETEWLLGRSQVYRKAYAEALRNFERVQAIAQESENPERWLTDDFYFDWAAALERSGNTGEAVGMFEKIIHRNPEHHSSLNYVAYMWAEQNENLEQALSYVQRALALEPENGSYLDTLAWIYYRQERYEEAYRKLLKCVELIPEESVVAEHLGDVLMKLERPWEAAGYYRIALLLDPAERLAIVEASLERAATALRNQLHAAVQDGNRNR